MNRDLILKLNEAWESYIRALSDNIYEISRSFSKLDFHGAHIQVIESPILHHIGLEGYIVGHKKTSIDLFALYSSTTLTMAKKNVAFAILLARKPIFIARL